MQLNSKKKKKTKKRVRREKLTKEQRINRNKMLFYTPQKLIYTAIRALYDSIIAEIIFVMAGLSVTAVIVFYINKMTHSRHMIAFVIGFLVLSVFETMGLLEVFRRICKLMLSLVKHGNSQYDFYRIRVRKLTGDSSLGFDGTATKSIYYFINKDKPAQEFTYIKD